MKQTVNYNIHTTDRTTIFTLQSLLHWHSYKNIHQTNTTSKFHINTVLLKTHSSLIVNIIFVHTLPFVTAGLLPLSVRGFMAMLGICFLNYTAYYRWTFNFIKAFLTYKCSEICVYLNISYYCGLHSSIRPLNINAIITSMGEDCILCLHLTSYQPGIN
jgi:hypothetical protein